MPHSSAPSSAGSSPTSRSAPSSAAGSTRARSSRSWRARPAARSTRSRSASRIATASTSARSPARSRSATRPTHHEEVVHPNAVELVETLVEHHDQPFGDSSAVPTYLLSEITRREVTVALSRRRRRRAVRRLRALRGGARAAPARPAARRRAGGRAPRAAQPRRARAALRAARSARPARRLPLVAELRRRAAAPTRCSAKPPTPGRSRTTTPSGRTPRERTTLDRLLNLNLRTYLVDDLLVKVDRMQHGPRPRGPLAVPRHRARRARAAPGAVDEGPRAARSSACCATRSPTSCPQRSWRAASAASASRWIAGFATTSPATSPRRSARPARA